MTTPSELFSYKIDKKYAKPAAYFSMEFAIDQPLKIYSGGLGFLAGSHMRSAYELKQNLVGIGILWKYGYYDQERNMDGTLKAGYVEKNYSFLTDTGHRISHYHSQPRSKSKSLVAEARSISYCTHFLIKHRYT
jgi:starch phosphorylase